MSKKTDIPRDGNIIWIELDRPIDKADAEKNCALANRMMKRFGSWDGRGFFWSERDCLYGLSFAANSGFIILTDYGYWFNLDHLGREE